MKTLLGRKRPLEALSAQIMIKDKLLMGLTGGGKVLIFSCGTIYQQLREPSQIRVCNKNILASYNGKMFSKGSTTIKIQLTTEMTVEFLSTRIEITTCLLGMEIF